MHMWCFIFYSCYLYVSKINHIKNYLIFFGGGLSRVFNVCVCVCVCVCVWKTLWFKWIKLRNALTAFGLIPPLQSNFTLKAQTLNEYKGFFDFVYPFTTTYPPSPIPEKLGIFLYLLKLTMLIFPISDISTVYWYGDTINELQKNMITTLFL